MRGGSACPPKLDKSEGGKRSPPYSLPCTNRVSTFWWVTPSA